MLIVQHMHLVEKLARQMAAVFVHVDIRDLAQTGFVGLVEAADRYQPCPGGFERFAYFRVRGAIIDSQKRRAYRDSFHGSLQAIAEAHGGWLPPSVDTDSTPLPDEILERGQILSLLAAARRSLSDSQQKLLLAWMHGRPTRELCSISGMSPNSTRGLVNQILDRLREEMSRPPAYTPEPSHREHLRVPLFQAA